MSGKIKPVTQIQFKHSVCTTTWSAEIPTIGTALLSHNLYDQMKINIISNLLKGLAKIRNFVSQRIPSFLQRHITE
jgi:hypothetical protein